MMATQYGGGPTYTEKQIADTPVSEEEYERYMMSDNCDLPIEQVEFFLPEFSE